MCGSVEVYHSTHEFLDPTFPLILLLLTHCNTCKLFHLHKKCWMSVRIKKDLVSSDSLVSLQGVEGVTPIPLPSNWYITTLGPYSSPRDLWPWPLMVTAGTKFSVILPLVSLICAVGEVAKGTVKWSVVTWSALDIPRATGTSLSHRVSTPVYPLQRHSGQW